MNDYGMTSDELIETAKAFRAFIEERAYLLDDDMALTMPTAYPNWRGDGVAYKTGDRIRYDGDLYKVLQPHTSQETWTPTDAPSLFALVLAVDEDEPTEWQQPDSTNGYDAGDIVIYNGTKYMSLIDNNIWAPDAYPAGWQVVV